MSVGATVVGFRLGRDVGASVVGAGLGRGVGHAVTLQHS
jgi:hypothetical protein